MYKIIVMPLVTSICRETDGAWIPMDEQNSDYQQYLAWVAEGNTAEEWSPDATV
jgi:hypothetical protein